MRFENLSIYKDLDDSRESYDNYKSRKFMTTICKISSKNRDDIYRKIESMSIEYIEYIDVNLGNTKLKDKTNSDILNKGILKYLNPRYLTENHLKSKLIFYL